MSKRLTGEIPWAETDTEHSLSHLQHYLITLNTCLNNCDTIDYPASSHLHNLRALLYFSRTEKSTTTPSRARTEIEKAVMPQIEKKSKHTTERRRADAANFTP